MAIYTTSNPSNWIKYPNNSTASSSSSHIVGWESKRYRIEKYSFTTGNYPITEVDINFGSVSHYGGNTNFNIYYYITPEGNYQNSISGGSSAHTGLITISNGKGTARTQIDLLKNTTYYIYVWSDSLSGTGAGWGAKSWSSSAATITATEIQTTKCGAPTSVTASGIVTPSGTFTVSWSGASSGTNNAISGYRVYYRVGATPTTSSYTGYKDVSSTSTSGSTSFTLNSANRGSEIVCGVITHGTAGSNYYSGIKTGGSIIINSLPSAPSVTVNKTFLTSNENSVTFSDIAAGTDANTSQTKTVWYSTSKDTNKIEITGTSLIQRIDTSIIYYFYTYDGMEYSSAKTIEIIKNIKPIINSINGVVPTYTFAGEDGKTETQLGYAYIILPTISVNKIGTLTVFIDMEASNDTTSPTNYSYTETFTHELTSYEFTPNNNYNIYTKAIAHFGSATMLNTNIKWRLRFQLSDNNEHSNIVYYPNDNKFYTIAHSAELKGVYNQFADSNIQNVLKGQVRKKVRLKFDNDTSVPNISVSAKKGNEEVKPLISTITNSSDNKFKYIDLTLPDQIAGGSTINIRVLFTDSDSQPTKISEYSQSVIETLVPTLTNFEHNAETIYPFTSNDNDKFEIKINWPFGSSYNVLDNNTLKNFNCSTQKTDGVHYDAIKLIHVNNENNVFVSKHLDWKKDSDWLVATPSRAAMYGWNNELGYDTYSGIKTYSCQFQITNLFGETFTLNLNKPRYFNFNEKAQDLMIQSIQWATSNTDSTEWKDFNNDNLAQETMYFKFNLNFKLFTKEEITIQLKRKIKDEESISISKTYPSGSSELTYASNRTAETNTVSLIYGPVGTISDTEKRVWSFQIINTRGTTESAGVEMKVQRQTAPDINFTSCSVDQNYKISYSFEQTDSGGGSIVNYLCDYDNKNELSSKSLNNPSSDGTSSGDIQLEPNVSDWETKSICIKSVSTINGLIKLEKECYSNYIIVYKISPTVAYRKNQLGINTDNPDADYIIDIRPTNKNKRIRLYNGISDVIELDLSKVYNNNNDSCPAIVIKKETNEGTSKKITEYTLLFD